MRIKLQYADRVVIDGQMQLQMEVYSDGSHLKTVDEFVSLVDIQQAVPKFFVTPHGEREVFEVYRGMLLASHTVKFTGVRPERRRVGYLYCSERRTVSHVGQFGSSRQMRNVMNALWKAQVDDVVDVGDRTFKVLEMHA